MAGDYFRSGFLILVANSRLVLIIASSEPEPLDDFVKPILTLISNLLLGHIWGFSRIWKSDVVRLLARKVMSVRVVRV